MEPRDEGTPTADVDQTDTPQSERRPASDDRLRALAPTLVFDVIGPLAVYFIARAAGASTIVALVVSGVLPAVRVVATVVSHRRLDAIGALVLSGIILGTVVGLISGNARLYLLDGLVPTVVFGIICLLSVLSSRPMMFRIALETMGPETEKGRDFAGLWQHQAFRHTFRVITVVWGLVFIIESAVQAVIIEAYSINTAKTTSNFLPIAVLVVTLAWTRNYGRRSQSRSTPAPEGAETGS